LRKRGWFIVGVVVLLGVWLTVVGYEFLEKENALWQKKVKAAKDDQRRCEARYAKYRNFDQFRTSIRLPYASDLPLERWLRQFNTLRAGMSEPEVEIILGAPDYARCDVSKEGDKFVGSLWQYEIAVPQDVANDGQNSAIQLVFGPDAKLKDKSAVNMQPAPKPGPSPSPAAEATPAVSGTATPAANGTAMPAASATPGGTGSPAGQAMPAATPGASATPAASPTPQ
jgi:hypothetical protein